MSLGKKAIVVTEHQQIERNKKCNETWLKKDLKKEQERMARKQRRCNLTPPMDYTLSRDTDY